ncbi:bacteriohemerythrin [Brachyspira hampsonii]|uniref:bacteriohemerythrin n=1 Tax=Brachyspira hampsonii TaxID=1287055 RepID=UPI000D39C209|nr:bacteriohemerythrin [Brachyspira hampsonii]PTY39266.1 hemerythrin [Brachyspira hampsonii bv. II]
MEQMAEVIVKKGWIKWEDRFRTGYKRIDNQHKELVNIINDLYETGVRGNISDDEVKKEFKEIIKRTIDYATYHFSYEEKIMKAINYSGSKDHISKHRAFSLKIVDEVNSYERGDDLVIKDFITFLKDWLLNHIVLEDKKFISEVKTTLAKMYEEEIN